MRSLEATDELVATTYEDERHRWYFATTRAVEADLPILQTKLPNTDLSINSVTATTGSGMVVAWRRRRPAAVLPPSTRKEEVGSTCSTWCASGSRRDQMAPMKSVTFKSSDGLEIPAYLTLPKGCRRRTFLRGLPARRPVVPRQLALQQLRQFLPTGAMPSSRRTSAAHPATEEVPDAGNLQWATGCRTTSRGGEVSRRGGIADPKRVGIMGGSYGATPRCRASPSTPDVYAAAVSIVGPSNLLTLLETIPPYWRRGASSSTSGWGTEHPGGGEKQLSASRPSTPPRRSRRRSLWLISRPAREEGRVRSRSSVALRDRASR